MTVTTKAARTRFIAAIALYAVWVVALATLAIFSASRPVAARTGAPRARGSPTPTLLAPRVDSP
jgi:hypothetical protein